MERTCGCLATFFVTSVCAVPDAVTACGEIDTVARRVSGRQSVNPRTRHARESPGWTTVGAVPLVRGVGTVLNAVTNSLSLDAVVAVCYVITAPAFDLVGCARGGRTQLLIRSVHAIFVTVAAFVVIDTVTTVRVSTDDATGASKHAFIARIGAVQLIFAIIAIQVTITNGFLIDAFKTVFVTAGEIMVICACSTSRFVATVATVIHAVTHQSSFDTHANATYR